MENLLTSIANNLGLENTGSAIVDLVFDIEHATYTSDFAFTKRILFDTLYGLYILRKRESLSLEPIIDGLRACHLLEVMAITEFFHGAKKHKAYPNGSALFVNILVDSYSLLVGWQPESLTLKDLEEMGLIAADETADIQELLQATPVINPVFARLKYTFEPFNSLVPIGIWRSES